MTPGVIHNTTIHKTMLLAWFNINVVCLLSHGRKAKATEHYSNDLGAEDDDIITDAPSPLPQHSLFAAPHGHSQPVGKVFVERNRKCELDFIC